MSKKLDINGNDLWVLSLFTQGYNREYYIREISTLLPISHGTAQTILERLEKNSSSHHHCGEKPGSSGSSPARSRSSISLLQNSTGKSRSLKNIPISLRY